MDILLLLVPLSLLLVGAIAWFMLWAVRNDQFDDLEGPAHTIIMDDDNTGIPAPVARTPAAQAETRPPDS